MEKIWNGIQLAFAAFGGWLGWVLGGRLQSIWYCENELQS